MEISKEFDKWLKDHNMTYEEHIVMMMHEHLETISNANDYNYARLAVNGASTVECAESNYAEYVKQGKARPRAFIEFGGSSLLLGPIITLGPIVQEEFK